MIERVQYIEILDYLNLPRDQFMLSGGAWLSIMGIRLNKDIDLIVTDNLRNQYDSYLDVLDPKYKDLVKLYIDIRGKHGRKQRKRAKAKDINDFVLNKKYYTLIDGYKFAGFRYFWGHKKIRSRSKDLSDIKGIKKFFANKKHRSKEYEGVFKIKKL